MFLAQSLTQDESVLRADRHDQAQAKQKSGNEGSRHIAPCEQGDRLAFTGELEKLKMLIVV
ncbi:hypothetical protein D3C72_2120420 [compost metagenome]